MQYECSSNFSSSFTLTTVKSIIKTIGSYMLHFDVCEDDAQTVHAFIYKVSEEFYSIYFKEHLKNSFYWCKKVQYITFVYENIINFYIFSNLIFPILFVDILGTLDVLWYK